MDLFDRRLTEQHNPDTVNIDAAGAAEIVDLINAEDSRVPAAVHSQRQSVAAAMELAVEAFRAGGRLIYVGAGTSGRLGMLDATECPPTFGVDPDMVQGIIAGGYMALVRSQEGAEDSAESGAAALDEVGTDQNDFVLGIAASSTTPFVHGALDRATSLGARTGILCCTEPGPELRELVDVAIVPLVGPEVIAGSTRMKAATATKLVLNTISTGAMILLGKVYKNLMVDLQAVSDKLVDRGERIVMAVTGATREEASAVIAASDGSVKTAIVVQSSGIGAVLAELYLADSSGSVRKALERAQAVSEAYEEKRSLLAPHPLEPPSDDALRLTLAALRALPKALSELVKGATDERLEARPAPEKWSVKQNIEHLIAFDQLVDQRLRAIFSQPDASFPNWDEEVENQTITQSSADNSRTEFLLMRFTDGRAKLIARLEATDYKDFTRTGRHELYGAISVYQLLKQLAWHDDHHLRAVRRLLNA